MQGRVNVGKVCLLAVGDGDPHRYGEGSTGKRHPLRQSGEDVAGDVLGPVGIAAGSEDQELIAKPRACVTFLEACANRLGGPRKTAWPVV